MYFLRRVLFLLAAAVLIVASSSCVVSSALDATKVEPVGNVRYSDGGTEVELTPVHCTSGQHQFFYGADFSDATGQSVRLIIDPLGNATLRMFSTSRPLEPGVIFQRNECETFHLEFQPSGWEINDVYDVGLRLEFSCRNTAGALATGTLSAAHCH